MIIISGWIAQSRAQAGESEDVVSRSSRLTPHASPFPRQVCTVNPEFIMTARRHPACAQALAAADLCTPDGVGVLWAARLAGVRLNERVTGSDGIHRLCERAAEQGWRVFFLGAAPGVAERAAAELTRLYPGLPVAGTYGGSPAESDWPQIRQRLAAAPADLLFVAYGHPRQDIWIHQHKEELPVAVALGVGGAFDFVAGITPRAPLWLRRLGLEWLFRLARQPWRWRRMAILPLFALLVLVGRARRRLGGSFSALSVEPFIESSDTGTLRRGPGRSSFSALSVEPLNPSPPSWGAAG